MCKGIWLVQMISSRTRAYPFRDYLRLRLCRMEMHANVAAVLLIVLSFVCASIELAASYATSTIPKGVNN